MSPLFNAIYRAAIVALHRYAAREFLLQMCSE